MCVFGFGTLRLKRFEVEVEEGELGLKYCESDERDEASECDLREKK